MAERKGLLVTLEGTEGAGKTTVFHRLIQELREKGQQVTSFREPGSTELGDDMRHALLDKHYKHDLAPETELMIFCASRAQLVNQEIIPALERGEIVILDRFIDSTIAYQGHTRGLGCSKVDNLLRTFITKGINPDLTLLFDVPVEIGLLRKNKAGGEFNRLDQEDVAFHTSNRQAYMALYAWDQEDRMVLLNANQDFEIVYSQVFSLVQNKIYFTRGKQNF